MATKKITKEAEAKLLRSLEFVGAEVADGVSPNEAIIKAASEGNLTHNQTQLMIQAYNNAKANRMRKSASIVADKTERFDLADPAIIFETLYPNVKEAAVRERSSHVSADYNRPPDPELFRERSVVEKAAAAPEPDPIRLPQEADYYSSKAFSLLKELDTQYDNLRMKAASAEQKVDAAFTDLLDYFNKLNREPFGGLREVTAACYGVEGNVLFEHIAESVPVMLRNKLVKEAGAVTAVDWNVEPYKLIKRVMDKSAEWAGVQQQLSDFSKEAGEASSQLVAHFMPLRHKTGSILRAPEKRAFMGNIGALSELVEPASGTGMGKAVTDTLSSAFDPINKPKMENKSLLAMMDPAHEQRLRSIRSQAVVHDLMANDEYLQGVHPDKLAKTYNEIVKIAPHVADQPLMMRSLLKSYLAQASVGPHEVDQLAGIEGKLREQRIPVEQPKMPG